ncbi:GNAT family N-acetyltransferase [Lentzea kentuckyensis]|uniref:GNAT family N-acetyltransferase n=1 Tax=Lentzea kentuckyensis TaxID=360086 RepID=UPI000A37D6D5|nr:GNAT family N-acetyltransferase [Lentzea kentuckyensis]
MSTIVETQVREAWPEDLDAVTAIYATYVLQTTVSFAETPPTRAQWGTRYWDIAGRGLPFLVAELDGQVVGMAFCSPWKAKSAYRFTVENSIYLDPRATGRGLGTALLEELLDRCATAGIREVIAVIVDNGNTASEKLHLRCGFTEVGRLHGVGTKHGSTLDTVLMQRHLTTSTRFPHPSSSSSTLS